MKRPKINGWKVTTNENGIKMATLPRDTTMEEILKYVEYVDKQLPIHNVGGSIDSMKKAMDSFKKELEAANEENPDDLAIKGANWGYNKAVEQFHNRFAKYYR